MMSYSSKDGTFPLTLEECEIVEILCNERIAEMESDLKSKDPHKYIFIKELSAKFNAIIKLMNTKMGFDDFRGRIKD